MQANEPAWHRALSVAFGVFMGIMPIWGYQLLSAIVLAKLFRLNIAIVILSANISIPPNLPWIIFLSLWLGALFLGLDEIIPWSSITFDLIKVHIKQYVIGSMLLAILAAILLGSISFVVFKRIERKG